MFFVVLIPLVVHAGWDYHEARRIDHALRRIRERNEPTSLLESEPRPRTIEAHRAAAHYQAAAALAGGYRPDEGEPRRAPASTTLLFRVRQAERDGGWTDALWSELRQYVDERREALSQLDSATPLIFEGFRAGTSYGYLAASLSDLARVGGYRTMVLANEGNGVEGASSLYAELRLRRAISRWSFLLPTASDVVAHLDLLLNRTRSSAVALKPVADGLAGLDHDDELTRWFLDWRAGFIDRALEPNRSASISWRGVPPGAPPLWLGLRATVERPWNERMVADRLAMLAVIVGTLDRPWPERVNAVRDAYASQGVPGDDETGFKRADVRQTDVMILELALMRCARVAVAIERYRREHAERMPSGVDALVPDYLEAVPVDPYSGGAMIARPEAASYVVYSLGANRRDEQGDFAAFRSVDGRQERRDVGLRIRYR